MTVDRENKAASRIESSKKMFSFWKILIPVFIGLAVVAFMFYHDASKENLLETFRSIDFNSRSIWCIGLAFLFIFGRDMGLSWRFRALTNKELPWRSAWEVDMLCEFTSCVTPSAVGGSSFGMIYLNSKGIEFGRATTLMMTTLFLDELFFVVACPIFVLLTPGYEIFSAAGAAFSHGVRVTFWLIYGAVTLWTLILFTGIIWKPRWIKSLIVKICKLRIMRRWRDKGNELGDNMIATSKALRNKPFKFWIEVFGATSLSWISRYAVVNALFLGFLPQADPMQWVILVRQLVLWLVLMISPTPGGSGLSEWLFSEYYGDLVPTAGMAIILAVIWRLITYYLYLVIGAIIVPGWAKNYYKRIQRNNHKDSSEKTEEYVGTEK